ncbi:MAG: DUF5115 domain-containing protein [Prevotella sp.]|nr:DUF5115 domain-containing protein [Prevotella sp.]
MTKKILLGMALVASLAACTDDYKDWLSPQVVNQPETVSFGNGSITTVGTIDFNTVTDEMVKVCSITAPTASDPAFTPSYSITLGDGATYDITADGMMKASDLQDYVVSQFGRRPVERTIDATVSMWLSNGITTVKTATSDVFHIIAIPKAPQISQNYYIVGGPNDWFDSAKNKTLKFSHSGKDVYEDPVFTVIFNASEGDTWFAIGDDEACEAIGNDNDWSKLFGTTKGNGNTDPTGNLDRRYNLSDDGSFCVPAGPRLIKVTINMMDYSYQIEALNIAENYYLIGGPGEWNNSKDQKFSHSDKSVFDDPVFTYTFESTGGEMWFAFGDDEAIDAVGEGVWNKLFGTTGASTDLSGSFDRRYNLDGDHSFCVDGSAKFYRFSVNMMTMTYEITPLNFSEFIYVPGNAQKYNTSAAGMPEWGWTPELAPALRSASFNGVYEGYAYMDGEFKFTKERNWNAEYNYDSFTSYGPMFTGQAGTGGNINCTEPGYYRLVADVANGSLTATKVTWGLVGPATPAGWDAGSYVVMNYNMADDCWEITTDLNADEFKFTTNGSWDINLGGDAANLEEYGPNLRINEAGTYTIKLYPSRAQSDKMYATIVKQ